MNGGPDEQQTWLEPRLGATLPATRETLERTLGPSPWLVVVPHDDDLVLGSGLLLALAARAGIAVHVAVCTDGSLGYANLEERAGIAATREREMRTALAALGLDAAQLGFLGFPDGELAGRLGARSEGQSPGLGQALTRVMREVRPHVVLGCHERDVHPDHRAVAWDTSIACFWASSDIWRELGEPIALPRHLHYGVYAAFDAPPDYRVIGDADAQARKLRALAAFESQSVIRQLVEQTRQDGPQEFFREATQRPHRAASYAMDFGPLPKGATGAALGADMERTGKVLASWPEAAWPPLVNALRRAGGREPLWLIGEGSSLAFPAHYAAWLARHWGIADKLVCAGGREAALHGVPVAQRCFLSNSGRTRELAELPGGAELLLSGPPDAPLAQASRHTLSLLPEAERAVAATISVFAQALCLAHALSEVSGHKLDLDALRRALRATLDGVCEPSDDLLSCTRLWWVDPGHHLADELALKTLEIAGLPAQSSQGTALLHGAVEVLGPDDGLIWIDPPEADLPCIQSELSGRAGARLHVLACPAADEEPVGVLRPLVQLAQGWRLLAALAVRSGRDPDHPRRARKIGNPMA